MKIRLAVARDVSALHELDHHIAVRELETLVRLNRVYVAQEDGEIIGWLRYNLFWDNTPFMNLLYLLEPWRGRGFGRRLVEHWEGEMRALGYGLVMTSTSSLEDAQFFYAKLGYRTVGGFVPEGDAYELMLAKRIAPKENA